VQKILLVLVISSLLLAASCGGGGSTTIGGTGSTTTSVAGGNTIVTSGNNVAPVIVDAGPALSSSSSNANTAFTTVVVCAPGSTTNCVTLDHVMIDTGSTGLRVPASLLSTLGLHNVNTSAPVAECIQFLDNSFFWGAVQVADVKIGGPSNTSEVASSVPIESMGDPSVPSGTLIPSSCSGKEEDTVQTLGANGLLGIGNYQYDCDTLGYVNPCTSLSTAPAGVYYTCSSSTTNCSLAAVPLTQQMRNPVSLFATDNNGVILELPAVPVGGQSGISAGQGSLVFGIGTQSNNGIGSGAVVLTLDANPADPAYTGFTTVFNGVGYPYSTTSSNPSFLDSGSNGFFFLDQPSSGIPLCANGWYCPSSTETLTAVNEATGGNTRGVQFNISNANTLFSTSNLAFSDLAGPNNSDVTNTTTEAQDAYFDWGLSFFYGRNVYTAIWGVSPPNSSVPAGPFWAY